jgi:acetoin utilization protein AcuB
VTRVNEIMTSGGVVTVEASASCHDAVTQMVRNKIRHLPVVEGTGTLCGIVTDRDLRHQLFAPQMFRSIGTVPVEELLAATPVRNVMSSPVISVGPDTDLQEAARIMAEEKLGSLPVVERGRIVGIVTETDLLRRIVGDNACCADVETIVVSYP